MTQGDIINIFTDAMYIAFRIATPFLIVSIAVGIFAAIFQSAAQINEQSLSFVPKIIAVAIILLFLGSWIMNLMSDFFKAIFERIAGM